MADPAAQNPAELLSLEEAADRLGVEEEQARAMVDEQMLVPAEEGVDPLRFTVAAVEAVRLAGG